jgi:hypothetical protein
MKIEPIDAIQAVMAAVQAAPAAVALANSAREFVTQMFVAGLISKEVQDATFTYCDAVCGAAKVGVVPASFQVRPDPA